MAVNGVEIEVGQTWKTRGGHRVVVDSKSGGSVWPWNICGGGVMYTVKDDGFEAADCEPISTDLIELVDVPNETLQERFAATDETAGHIDRASNQPFPDIKADDAAFGNVDLRQVFGGCEPAPKASGGAKLERKSNYYQVQIDRPVDLQSEPYLAECADIIEALNMTFNEGEAFKALWRLAAGRQGRTKAGGNPIYDADKVAHYGARTAAHTRAQQAVAK